MLLNAFKSIYKQAYVKGIASAVVLTAGLAAGQAGATAVDFSSVTAGQEIEIDGDDTTLGQKTSVADKNDVSFTVKVTGGDTSTNYVSGGDAAATDVALDASDWIVETSTKTDGFAVKGGASGATLSINSLAVNRGTVEITKGTGAANLELNTLTVGTTANKATDLANVTATININGTVGNQDSSGEDGYNKSSAITINNGGRINFTGTAADSTNKLQGGTLTINGGFLTVGVKGSGGTVSVADGVMNAGTIQVVSGGTLNLTLADLKTSASTYKEKTFTVNGGTIDVAGTLALSGGTANGEAVFDFSDEDVELKASGASVSTAKITVSGASETGRTVLRISEDNLSDYLGDSDAGGNKDNEGAVEVKAHGVLEVEGDVDLDALNFGTAGSASAGQVGVAQKAILEVGDVTLDTDISDGGKFSGSLAGANVKLDTGTADDNRSTLKAFLGNNSDGLIVSESLTVTGTAPFTLDDTTTFDTGDDYAGQSDKVGSINASGELLIKGARTNVHGSWEADADITVGGANSSELALGGNNGSYAYLDMGSHTLKLTDTAGLYLTGQQSTDGQVKTATLDVSEGTLEASYSSASTTGHFEIRQYGRLLISPDNLETLLENNTSGAKIEVKANGTVETVNSLELAFNDLTSTAANGKLALAAGGTLKVNGALTLTEDTTASQAISFAGTVEADSLALNNNKSRDEGQALTGDRKNNGTVLVSGGTFNIAGDITTVNDTIQLSGDGTGAPEFNLSTDGEATVDSLELTGTTNAPSVNVSQGSWTFDNLEISSGSVTVGNTTDKTDAALTVAGKFVLNDSAVTQNVTVNNGSSLILNEVDADNGKVTVNGDLTVNGKYTAAEGSTPASYGVSYGNDVFTVNNGGTLTFTGDALDGMFAGTNGAFDTANYGKLNDEAGSEVVLDFDNTQTFDAKELIALKGNLFSSVTGDNNTINGVINVGNARLEGIDIVGGRIAWDKVAAFADVNFDVTSYGLQTATVTDIDVAAAASGIRGQYGALEADKGVTSITISANSSLSDAETVGEHEYFAYNADGKVVNLTVKDDVSLSLNNGGEAGIVTLQGTATTANSHDTVLNVNNTADSETVLAGITGTENGTVANITDGLTTVTGDISGLTELNVAGDLNVGGDVDVKEFAIESGTVSVTGANSTFDAEDFYSAQGTELNVNELNLGTAVTDLSKVTDGKYAYILHGEDNAVGLREIAGTVNADTVTINDHTIINGSLTADTLNGTQNAYILVGTESLAEEDDPDTEWDETFSSPGYLVVNTLNLNGAELVVDPDYGQAPSVAVINRFSDAVNKSDLFAGTVDGKVFVGKNAILGLGFSSVEDVMAFAGEITGGAAFSDEGMANLLAIGKTVNIENGQTVRLTGESYDDFSKAYTGTADLYMSSSSVIAIDGSVFTDADGNPVSAITFDKGATASVHAETGAEGEYARVIINGEINPGDTFNVFSDGTDGVNVTGTIKLQSVNGFWTADINSTNGGYNVALAPDADNARAIMHGASDPVYNTLMAYAYGDRNWAQQIAGDPEYTASPVYSGRYYSEAEWTALTDAQRTELTADGFAVIDHAEDGTPVYGKAAESAFLNRVLDSGNGSDAESVARLAVYGGAAEVALAASSVTSDAIASRMGMGNPNGNLVMADNEKGAGLWLAPMYKNHESDNFDAQGVDYGVDLDLTGVALGADYTFGSNVRGGAMFAIGSGDADGQGAGSAVSNDFDFWSVGVYGGYAYEAFSLTADLSWTQVDNDIDANTAAAGKVSASMDADVLSAGLTAKYDFDLDMVKVAPHLGMRYTSIDIDDYTVSDIASSDVDSISVFSIPAGLMFSADIATASGWNVKPALDLTVTLNTGDDEVDSDVRFNGVDMTTDLTSEFIDDVTYGATVGVQVQKDAFQFGLGVNYTGSDNTDEFGVGANARFTF